MNNLSIIIPVRSQDNCWQDLATSLLASSGDFEILVVGPDFKDKKSDSPRLRFIYSPQGRAKQQNLGAKHATKDFLWFLHADSEIDTHALKKVEEKIKAHPNALFYFDLSFIKDGPFTMPLNSLGTYLRSRLFKMPFGDQGLFLSKKNFYSLGAFDEKALYGEDHLLVWRARQNSIDILPAEMKISTSSRKYKKNGWLKTTLTHLLLTYKQAFPEWIKYMNKRPTAAIAIFVKTPGVSTVKSRLASHIGKDKAEEFYSLSLKATEAYVIEALKNSKGELDAYWAVAEKSELNNPLWGSFKTISQGEGDLGDRLHEIYSTLKEKHSQVFLIGADLPHLNPKVLNLAHKQLAGSNPFILGETDDGGFYLFGGKSQIEKSVWKSVPYSVKETSQELKKSLGEDHFSFLEKNFDIDYHEDLQLLATLENQSELPEQQEIIKWIKNFIK